MTNIIHGRELAAVLREKVQDAIARQEIPVSEHAEFYLVSLLQNFHDAGSAFAGEGDESLQKPLAIMFIEALESGGQERIVRLRRLGDSALILSGFFGESLNQGIVQLPYYVSLGRSAYHRLSALFTCDRTFAQLYAEMDARFTNFMDVLAAVAPWNSASSNTDLVHIYERWLETGDKRLAELLESEGILSARA